MNGVPDRQADYFTSGYHPWWLEDNLSVSQLAVLEDLYTRHKDCLGIGECGLDALRGLTLERQEENFIMQLEVASRCGAPVIIHCVRAFDRLLRLARTHRKTPWVVHGFVRNKMLALSPASLVSLLSDAGTGKRGCGRGCQSMPPASTPLRLTEIYYNTPGADEAEEWIEIANLGTETLDLSDIKVGDATGSGSREGMVRFPEGATLEPGQAIVVAQTATGFRTLFGQNPAYEITPSDETVPDMRLYRLWATGAVWLSNDGDEVVLLNKASGFIDGVNYGDSTTLFEPAVLGVFTGQSIERVPADCDTDAAADWQPQELPTPGLLTFDGECTTPEETLDLLPIGQIQGSGPVAVRVNETVTFRGLVTGVYAERNTAGLTYYTLFVQDIPGTEDGDPATSDAVAVFLGREQPRYTLGDQVLVTGRVTEFFGFTEIEDDGLEITLESQGNPLPAAVEINPPAENAAATLEPLEAMRVSLPQSLVVGPTIGVCSFAVVRADAGVTRIVRQQESDPIGQIVPILHTSDTNCTSFPQDKTGELVGGLVDRVATAPGVTRIWPASPLNGSI